MVELCFVVGFLPRFETWNDRGKSLISNIQFIWHEIGVDQGDYVVVRERTASGDLTTQSTVFCVLLALFPNYQHHQ